MVRVRAYRFVLALPLLLAIAGVALFWAAGSLLGDKAFSVGWWIFVAAVALQLVFSLCLACPKCGKSPYALGPHRGPFALAGKPLPDRVCSKCGHEFVSQG